MKDHANVIATVLGIVVTGVTIIAAFSNAFDRVARHQITIEDHEKRIDAIERDQTTSEKLQKLTEAINYANWQIESLKKSVETIEKRGRH